MYGHIGVGSGESPRVSSMSDSGPSPATVAPMPASASMSILPRFVRDVLCLWALSICLCLRAGSLKVAGQ